MLAEEFVDPTNAKPIPVSVRIRYILRLEPPFLASVPDGPYASPFVFNA